MNSYEIAKAAIRALDSKKARDIEAIKVDDLTILADYFIIATGTSSTQVKALADEVDFRLSEEGVQPNHIEGRTTSWIVLDYGSVIVHVFYGETRDFYSLERLWSDGAKIDINEFLQEKQD